MSIDVFLSIGRTFTEEQHVLAGNVRGLLTTNGLSAVTVETTDTREDPLLLVMSVMDRCGGALIVALERLMIASAQEWRGAPHERAVSGASLPTP